MFSQLFKTRYVFKDTNNLLEAGYTLKDTHSLLEAGHALKDVHSLLEAGYALKEGSSSIPNNSGLFSLSWSISSVVLLSTVELAHYVTWVT